MAAVLGLDDDLVEVACRRADADVWVANFNAPGQVVIAGSPEGVGAAGAVAKELGAKKIMPLQVSGVPHAVHDART
jgi:[acyl-carrier-protein] S-malonyltransferase